MSIVNRVRCDVPAEWLYDFSQCLFEWQGLVGGILAVFAAMLGATLLWRQIHQSDVHRRDELERRHIAAKLTMPLALSVVSEAVQNLANEIAEELETYQADEFYRTLDAIPSNKEPKIRFNSTMVPSEVLGTFERFVETLSHSSDIKHVSELIASLQIFISRFNDLNREGAGAKFSLEELLLDAAKIKVLNDAMFNYARNVVEAPFGLVGVISTDDAWIKIKGAAQGLVFLRPSPDFFFPAINRSIDHATKESISPWLREFSS